MGLTANQLERMVDDDSVRTELDQGELITRSLGTWGHGLCAAEAASILQNHVKMNQLGRVYIGGTGFRLSEVTVRAPSVAFVRQERLQTIASSGFAKGAPDLAVEIFSPTDSVPQLMRKVKQSFAAGCHTVWIVYPDSEEVHVLDAAGRDDLLHEGDTIEAPDLLPGFSVAITEFFS